MHSRHMRGNMELRRPLLLSSEDEHEHRSPSRRRSDEVALSEAAVSSSSCWSAGEGMLFPALARWVTLKVGRACLTSVPGVGCHAKDREGCGEHLVRPGRSYAPLAEGAGRSSENLEGSFNFHKFVLNPLRTMLHTLRRFGKSGARVLAVILLLAKTQARSLQPRREDGGARGPEPGEVTDEVARVTARQFGLLAEYFVGMRVQTGLRKILFPNVSERREERIGGSTRKERAGELQEDDPVNHRRRKRLGDVSWQAVLMPDHVQTLSTAAVIVKEGAIV
eukprot:299392-Hanusia_phi.AAC.1